VDSKKFLNLTLIAVLLGGISIFYFNYNPTQHSFFIPCPFKFTTGYHCPGCGSQRAIHQLLHGDVISAFRFNPLMVLSLPLIFYGMGIKVKNYLYNTQSRVQFFYSKLFIYSYFGIAILYWIIRNIPYAPFTYLAPNGV